MNSNKSSKKIWVVATVVLTLGIGAAVYALAITANSPPLDTNETSTVDDNKPNEEPTGNPKSASETTITFTNEGFANSPYIVRAGEIVKVTNNSSQDLQFSSEDHPSHLEEPALNMQVLAPGSSGTFTAPSGPGEYRFHDHILSEFTGTLIVE